MANAIKIIVAPSCSQRREEYQVKKHTFNQNTISSKSTPIQIKSQKTQDYMIPMIWWFTIVPIRITGLFKLVVVRITSTINFVVIRATMRLDFVVIHAVKRFHFVMVDGMRWIFMTIGVSSSCQPWPLLIRLPRKSQKLGDHTCPPSMILSWDPAQSLFLEFHFPCPPKKGEVKRICSTSNCY